MLRASGAQVLRAGFNRGDQAFWRDAATYHPYRGTPEEWPTALEALLEDGPVSRPVAYIMLQRNAVLSRLFLGNRTADAMQVPKTRWRLPVLASGPLVFAGDRLLGLTRRTRAWRDRLGHRLFAGALLPETRGFIPTMDGRPVVAESVS